MEMARKIKIAKIAAILWVLVVLGGLPAQAGPFIDGRFDPSEGYTYATSYWVHFEVEGGKNQPNIPVSDPGQLWTYQESLSGNLSVIFIQPTSLVDNSYGNTRIGWGAKEHYLLGGGGESLIGSDKAEFTITDGSGSALFSFKMDYIAEDMSVPSGTNPYVSSGVQKGGVFDKGDGGMYVGSASHFMDWATSQEYNMNMYYENDITKPSWSLIDDSPTANSDYTNVEAAYSDWIFEVIYEFKIDGNALSGYSDLYIDIVHDSPNKIGKNKVYDDLELFPVPSAVILGVIGLGFSSWLGRRKFSV